MILANKTLTSQRSYLRTERASTEHFFWKSGWKKLKRNKPALVAFALLNALVLGAAFIPFFSQYTYYETFLSWKNATPSSRHWFGTDELGRDIFVRVWWGARISLFVGISAAVLDAILGGMYGAIAGYYGGKVDECMMRLVDIFHSLPNLLIVIMLMVVIGSGLGTIILALVLTGWITMARITRGQILSIKESDYVHSAKMFGASPLWIIRKHLLPNMMGSIVTTLTFSIPIAIFTETYLSFLGLGVQAPVASWGTMANDGLFAIYHYPWRLFFPVLFICITMLSFNILGDGIRDAFDPRLKQ